MNLYCSLKLYWVIRTWYFRNKSFHFELIEYYNWQEKEWLRTFYYDIEKCIRQNESEAEFVEVCLAVLHQIRDLRCVKDTKDYQEWLPVSQQVVPLDTLLRESSDVCGGSLCSQSEEESSIPGW